MKQRGRLSGLLLLLLLLVGLALMGAGITRRDYVAEWELPGYCLYERADELSVTVRRHQGELLERVVCLTPRAEESALEIGWRSMVYWGYRGAIPFASSYPYGEDAPKMHQADKDNYRRAKTFTMPGGRQAEAAATLSPTAPGPFFGRRATTRDAFCACHGKIRLVSTLHCPKKMLE